MKGALTKEAKEAARKLVAAWDEGRVTQQFIIVEIPDDNKIRGSFVQSRSKERIDFDPPLRHLMDELAHVGLVQITEHKPHMREILLLQALREAVHNDFAQDRDVPITVTGAIGTFINGSLTMDKGAVFSSSAYGDITVTFQTLPEELMKLIGADTLQLYPEIHHAIQELKSADELNRVKKAGKVIEELGRVLGHLSNTGGAIAAIALIARFLGG